MGQYAETADAGTEGQALTRPVDERVGSLVLEDGPEDPGDDGGSSNVSLVGLERVSDSGRLEEEKREEHKDLGSDAGVVVDLSAERLESGQDDEDERPGVVEGERKVNKQLVEQVSSSVVPLDLDVDGGHGRGDEDGRDKGEDVHRPDAEERVRRREQTEEGEPPLDLVDDQSLALLSCREERVGGRRDVRTTIEGTQRPPASVRSSSDLCTH